MGLLAILSARLSTYLLQYINFTFLSTKASTKVSGTILEIRVGALIAPEMAC